MDILGFLFPKKCVNCKKFGDYLCTDCFAKLDFNVPLICAVCGKRAIGGLTHPGCQTKYSIDGVFASVIYRGITKKLVYQFKFQPNLSDLKRTIGDLFYEGLIQQEGFYQALDQGSYLVPIPLHDSRLKERGYNQADLLAADLGGRLQIPVRHLLLRKNKTSSQVGKKEAERRENIKGVFETRGSPAQIPHTVFLVDDVVTSGATFNEAANILKRAGVKKVWGLAFSHGV
jgi:ComF family protein